MKRHILTIAMLTGVLTANLTFANNDLKIVDIMSTSELQLKALTDLKFRITVDNVEEKSYIIIKSSAGETLHSETISKSESFNKIFDLSNLPDGNYTFELTTGGQKSTKPFEITTKTKRTALPK